MNESALSISSHSEPNVTLSQQGEGKGRRRRELHERYTVLNDERLAASALDQPQDKNVSSHHFHSTLYSRF